MTTPTDQPPSTTRPATTTDPEVTITLNGEPTSVPADLTTRKLVAHLGLPDRGIAVAVDGAVVRASEWDSTGVRAGDTVDIVTAMQGG